MTGSVRPQHIFTPSTPPPAPTDERLLDPATGRVPPRGLHHYVRPPVLLPPGRGSGRSFRERILLAWCVVKGFPHQLTWARSRVKMKVRVTDRLPQTCERSGCLSQHVSRVVVGGWGVEGLPQFSGKETPLGRAQEKKASSVAPRSLGPFVKLPRLPI